MARKTSTTKRKYPYYRKSTSIVKRAKGNIAASKKQNDVADFTITFNHTFPVTSYKDPNNNKVYSGYAMNIWDLLSKAPNFKAFQSMYDQVRINGVQIKLQTANSTVSTNNANTIYNVYTAWDTDGMDKSLISPVITTNQDNTENIVGFRTSLNSAIATYGSSSKMQLNPFQRWTQNRSLYPSNMQEKTQFVSTDSIFDYHESYNNQTKYFEFSDIYKKLGINSDPTAVDAKFTEIMNQDNPAILASNQKYPFKPTFYVDAFSSAISDVTHKVDSYIPVDSNNELVFTAEIRVPCTFRGLKGIVDV